VAHLKKKEKEEREAENTHKKAKAEKNKQQFLTMYEKTQSYGTKKNYPMLNRPTPTTAQLEIHALSGLITPTALGSKPTVTPDVTLKPITLSNSSRPKSTLKIVQKKGVPVNTKPSAKVIQEVEDISSKEEFVDIELPPPTYSIDEQLQTQQDEVPRESLQTDYVEKLKHLTSEVAQLRADQRYLHDVCIPAVKHVVKIFGGLNETNRTEFSYIDIPIGVSPIEWQHIYPTIFGGVDTDGNQLWADTAPLWIENGVSTKTSDRAGQETPSIAFSIYQYLDCEQVPYDFKIPHAAHAHYLHLRQWFLHYHFPFVSTVFGTVDPQQLDNIPGFFDFICQVVENRVRNKKRSNNKAERGNQYVEDKVVAFRQRRNGAHLPATK
jgi:hypothetical protein